MDVSATIRIAVIIIGIMGIALLGYLAYEFWNASVLNITVKWIAGVLIVFLIGFVSKHLAMLVSIRTTFKKYFGLFLLSIFGFFASNIYLWLINPLYNKSGRLRKDDQGKSF